MKKKQLLAILLLCIGLTACYSYNPALPRYTKLALVSKLPFVYEYENGVLKGGISNDSVCITHAGDYIVYDLPHHYQEEVNDSIVFDGIRMEYFIYKKGQTHGYLYKKMQDTKGRQLPVDSVFKTKIDKEGYQLTQRFSHVARKLVYNGKQELTLVKLYPKNEKMLDSVYLNFSKQYARLGHSLSRQTDAQYGSTLYKITMFLERENDTIPGSAYVNQYKWISCEMIPLQVTNEKELTDFIERYKKQMAGKK
jgi:hypothetical protein